MHQKRLMNTFDKHQLKHLPTMEWNQRSPNLHSWPDWISVIPRR